MADQIDHYLPTHQGSTPPVLRDVAKHPVLDFVPFAGPRRQVTYRNPQPDIIGQLLQLHLPQAVTATLRAAPLNGVTQNLGTMLDRAAHVLAPTPDRFFGELSRDVVPS